MNFNRVSIGQVDIDNDKDISKDNIREDIPTILQPPPKPTPLKPDEVRDEVRAEDSNKTESSKEYIIQESIDVDDVNIDEILQEVSNSDTNDTSDTKNNNDAISESKVIREYIHQNQIAMDDLEVLSQKLYNAIDSVIKLSSGFELNMGWIISFLDAKEQDITLNDGRNVPNIIKAYTELHEKINTLKKILSDSINLRMERIEDNAHANIESIKNEAQHLITQLNNKECYSKSELDVWLRNIEEECKKNHADLSAEIKDIKQNSTNNSILQNIAKPSIINTDIRNNSVTITLSPVVFSEYFKPDSFSVYAEFSKTDVFNHSFVFKANDTFSVTCELEGNTRYFVRGFYCANGLISHFSDVVEISTQASISDSKDAQIEKPVVNIPKVDGRVASFAQVSLEGFRAHNTNETHLSTTYVLKEGSTIIKESIKDTQNLLSFNLPALKPNTQYELSAQFHTLSLTSLTTTVSFNSYLANNAVHNAIVPPSVTLIGNAIKPSLPIIYYGSSFKEYPKFTGKLEIYHNNEKIYLQEFSPIVSSDSASVKKDITQKATFDAQVVLTHFIIHAKNKDNLPKSFTLIGKTSLGDNIIVSKKEIEYNEGVSLKYSIVDKTPYQEIDFKADKDIAKVEVFYQNLSTTQLLANFPIEKGMYSLRVGYKTQNNDYTYSALIDYAHTTKSISSTFGLIIRNDLSIKRNIGLSVQNSRWRASAAAFASGKDAYSITPHKDREEVNALSVFDWDTVILNTKTGEEQSVRHLSLAKQKEEVKKLDYGSLMIKIPQIHYCTARVYAGSKYYIVYAIDSKPFTLELSHADFFGSEQLTSTISVDFPSAQPFLLSSGTASFSNGVLSLKSALHHAFIGKDNTAKHVYLSKYLLDSKALSKAPSTYAATLANFRNALNEATKGNKDAWKFQIMDMSTMMLIRLCMFLLTDVSYGQGGNTDASKNSEPVDKDGKVPHSLVLHNDSTCLFGIQNWAADFGSASAGTYANVEDSAGNYWASTTFQSTSGTWIDGVMPGSYLREHRYQYPDKTFCDEYTQDTFKAIDMRYTLGSYYRGNTSHPDIMYTCGATLTRSSNAIRDVGYVIWHDYMLASQFRSYAARARKVYRDWEAKG